LPWLPWNINNSNSQFSKAQLTTLSLNNFKTTEAMGLKIIASYCITSEPKFMEIYQAVQKLFVRDTQTDRQTGDFISLTSFLESRLKRRSCIILI
jgi:hypothetical protein